MPIEAPLVAVILLNWNGWRDTVQCVESLRHLDYPRVLVIVVDNASADDSVKRIRAAFPNVTLIENHENLGYAGGTNVGIRYALDHGAAMCWLLNNDTIAPPEALTPLVRAASEAAARAMALAARDLVEREYGWDSLAQRFAAELSQISRRRVASPERGLTR